MPKELLFWGLAALAFVGAIFIMPVPSVSDRLALVICDPKFHVTNYTVTLGDEIIASGVCDEE